MFTEDERKVLTQVRMSEEKTNEIWHIITQKKKKSKMKFFKVAIISSCIFLFGFSFTPAKTVAEDLWKNSWFYSGSTLGSKKDNQPTGKWKVFHKSVVRDKRLYTSISEISDMLDIPLLYSDVLNFNEVWYDPSLVHEEIGSVHLWGHNKEISAKYIPKQKLYEDYSDGYVSEKERQKIDDIYKMSDEDIASYYPQGLTYSALMYSKASGASGDIRVLIPTNRNIVYESKALECEITIELPDNPYGPYVTRASWIKDDVLYELIGYISVDDMKVAIETMHY